MLVIAALLQFLISRTNNFMANYNSEVFYLYFVFILRKKKNLLITRTTSSAKIIQHDEISSL